MSNTRLIIVTSAKAIQEKREICGITEKTAKLLTKDIRVFRSISRLSRSLFFIPSRCRVVKRN